MNTAKMETSADTPVKKRKCKNYTAKEKLEILKALENASPSKVAQQYAVDARTIRNWRQNRSQLEILSNSDNKLQTKRLRRLPFESLGKAVHTWFHEMRLRGIPLNGPIIQAKALELSNEMVMLENFVASEGWLSKWKIKYHIRELSISGEKMCGDITTAYKSKQALETKIKEEGLTLAQIFNVDETFLNYRMLPSASLAEEQERQISGVKQKEDHVTVMLCSNADASLKLPLLVVGKSAKSKAIRNIPKTVLPVCYANQLSALMDLNIFEKWFKDEFVPRVTCFLQKKNLPVKAVLLLDNAPCHPAAEVLSVNDIKAYSLSFLVQPMSQGVTETLKRQYKAKLLRSILCGQKSNIDVLTCLKSVTMKDVVYWVSDAWNEVTPTTIVKCWKDVLPVEHLDNIVENSCVKNEVTTEDLIHMFHQIENYKYVNEEIVRNWIRKDDNVVSEMPSNYEILQKAIGTSDDESDDENIVEEDVSPDDAISAANKLMTFFEDNSFLNKEEFAVLRKARDIAIQLHISE